MSSEYKTAYTQVVDADALSEEEASDSGYQALSGLAVWSMIFGMLSLLVILSDLLLVLPLGAILLGWLALRKIRSNPGETTGTAAAWSGIVVAVVFTLAGYGWKTYQFHFAVPDGYELITYAQLQPDPNDLERLYSEDAEMLDKRKVFVRGYMFPSKQQAGLREFLLVDDPGACNFCAPTPRPTQLIRVKLAGSLKMKYTTRMIGVGGKFSVEPVSQDEAMRGLVYQIEGDCVR